MLNDARALYTQNRAEEVKKKSINEWSINKSWDTLLSPYWEWHSDTTRSTSEWGEIFGNSIQPRALQHWRWAWEQKGIIKINILFLSIVILVFFFLPRSSRALYQKSLCVSFTSSSFFSGRNLLSFTNFVTSVLCSARGWVIRPVQQTKTFWKMQQKHTAKK